MRRSIGASSCLSRRCAQPGGLTKNVVIQRTCYVTVSNETLVLLPRPISARKALP